MSVTWNIDPAQYLERHTRAVADSIEADIVELVESLLNTAESWMKANHRWVNRTGDAEAALYTDIEHTVRQSVTLLMSHGPAIEYAWFLEANPSFALLGDASDHIWPLLYQGALTIVRRHSG
jgi:hypothetical protein